MGPDSIINHFENLTDPREDNKRHNLIDIIVITICAVICSADKWEDIKAYGIAKEEGYRRFLELPHGIPSHDTIRRVFVVFLDGLPNPTFSLPTSAPSRFAAVSRLQ